MNFLQIKDHFKKFPIFSVGSLRKFDPKLYSARLTEWQKKGYIKKIIRNYYIFSDQDINEAILYFIANSIYKPSYISFEMALSYFGLIPEGIYTFTSASSRKTAQFNTPVGNFMYRKIDPKLMFGYKIVKHGSFSYKIAEMEKAILDYFYLNSDLKTENDFYEMRINNEQLLSNLNLEKLNKYLAAFHNKALEKRINNFLKFIHD
ncbi:MAG: hypothetical protein AAB953_01385 [Patescibacteria group bacterium]